MKLYSLENDFQNGSVEQKKSMITRDAFDLLVEFLRGKYTIDELNGAIQQLSGLGVMSTQEITGLLQQKADKEACETSVGTGPEEMKELWGRVAMIEKL